MKLVNTLYNLEFDLIENQILVLSIENHLAYSNILETLWKQYKGEGGDFILSDESKELNYHRKWSAFIIFLILIRMIEKS